MWEHKVLTVDRIIVVAVLCSQVMHHPVAYCGVVYQLPVTELLKGKCAFHARRVCHAFETWALETVLEVGHAKWVSGTAGK